jgi:hypothetical protein
MRKGIIALGVLALAAAPAHALRWRGTITNAAGTARTYHVRGD